MFTISQVALAQVYSEVDTLSIITVSGYPGDTVAVPFDLVNTFAVGGFQVRVTYDSLALNAIAMNLTTRSQRFDLFGANFDDLGVAAFYATSWYPIINAIPPGTGPIATLDMVIRNQALPGSYPVSFSDTDSISHQNALSNSRGDSLIIPIFVERQVVVLSRVDVDDKDAIPGLFALTQNYPNPFNGTTKVSFTLDKPAAVKLSILDVLGKTVAIPYSGLALSGETIVTWNGRNSYNQDLVSGLYLYILEDMGGNMLTKKMTLLK
jgi:hypothetical protein